MPYTIGLTGGIGSGKSSAADVFAGLGAAVVDSDAIAHGLTGPGGAAMAGIRAEFGDRYVDASGALDRAAMRTLAFEDPGARKRLEAILHPMIRRESDRLAAAATGPYVVLMIPLLVESGAASGAGRARFDRIVVVDCPEDLQVRRVMTRSGMPEVQVRAIMATQASRAARLAAADDVIDNSGDTAGLRRQVESLHQDYVRRAKA